MAYTNIQPPFSLKFTEMPKRELRQYFQWYLNVLPERIGILTGAVRQSPGWETWEADYSPDSLNTLGEWFATQVQTRARTPEEIQEEIRRIGTSFPDPQAVVSSNILTIRTLSLAMDVGMYVSQVFLKSHPSLRWDQPLGGKTFVDYGQPGLAGFGPRGIFNPTRMVIPSASAVANRTLSGSRLREIYEIWAKMIRDK